MEGDAGNTERARELFHRALSVKANPQTLSAMATLERRYMPPCCNLPSSLECAPEHLQHPERTACSSQREVVQQMPMLHGLGVTSESADPQVWPLRGGTHAAEAGAGAQPSASSRPVRAETGGRSLQISGRFSRTAVSLQTGRNGESSAAVREAYGMDIARAAISASVIATNSELPTDCWGSC